MSKPTHIAYIVNKAKEGTGGKDFWRSVGAVFQHGKGGGFDLVIHDQLAISGRIVCREAKDDRVEQEPQS